MKRAVYTALFGSYESLVEQPIASESTCDFHCFTDSLELQSTTWKVHHVEPAIPLDDARSVRQLKIVGHPLLEDYQESLWIDNRIVLTRKPEEIMQTWLGDHDLALIRHSQRATVSDEYDAVLRKYLDDPSRVREQRRMVEQTLPEVLSEQPYWGAIIARRNTIAVRAAMREWMDNVLRYSRRDQLSLNFVLRRHEIEVNAQDLDNRQSEIHRWLTTAELPKDRSKRYGPRFRYSVLRHVADNVITSRTVRHIRWRVIGD